jgi:hypothetical protein
MKIMSSQQGSRAICILSATGTISNVTLRQSTSSGGTLTYEVSSISCYRNFLKFRGPKMQFNQKKEFHHLLLYHVIHIGWFVP